MKGKDDRKVVEEEGEAKKKKAGKSKKSHTSLGGLPSLSDAKQVTTNTDSGVARSMGGLAVAPGLHQMQGIPGFGPPVASMRPPSYAGAKMSPPPPKMAAGLPAKAREQSGKSSARSAATVRSAPYGWKFKDVPVLPEFHPLERTAVFVPQSSATEVGRRIADVLRSRSIAVTYDDKKAKAKCMTEDNVDFRVRLYRGRGKFSHGIIVEVQRRFGFSVNFHDDMYAVLDAAEGKALPTKPPTILDKLVPVVSEVDTDDEYASVSSGSKRKASLGIASDMLKRSRTVDANVLALESLASLTNPVKMGKSTALRVSRQILSGAEEGIDVRDAVVSLLVGKRLDIAGSNADVWEDDEGLSELRLLAMTIMTNTISVVANSGSPALLKDQSVFLSQEILPVLVDELREAKSNPRMAVMSARCLKTLISSRAIGREMVIAAQECGAVKALENALGVGERGNNNLATASSGCLEVLGSG